MARFERSRERTRDSRDRAPRRDNRDRRSFDDGPRGRRESGRESNTHSRGSELKMTKVICSSCGDECEVPFKPDLTKPVYCRECFAKKGGSSKPSNRDFSMINEKLDKIMKALDIE